MLLTTGGTGGTSSHVLVNFGNNTEQGLITPFNRFHGKTLIHIYQGLHNYKLDSIYDLYLVRFSWFIQNQIKGGSPSAHVHSNAQAVFINTLS